MLLSNFIKLALYPRPKGTRFYGDFDKGGMIIDDYGDKRFRWNRSINYFGAFKTIKKADREKIRLKLRAEAYLSS